MTNYKAKEDLLGEPLSPEVPASLSGWVIRPARLPRLPTTRFFDSGFDLIPAGVAARLGGCELA